MTFQNEKRKNESEQHRALFNSFCIYLFVDLPNVCCLEVIIEAKL